MKKLYILLLPALCILNAQAQITITRADFGQVGDQILYAHDTTLGTEFSVGASGPDQTWDFNTGAVSANFYENATFIDPTTFQGAPEESNIVLVSDIRSDFFHITNDAVSIVIPLSGIGPSNPAVKIADFPMNYLSSTVDSTSLKFSGTPDEFGLSQLPFDSIRVSINVRTHSLTDGWGTLKIDNDSFSTLRVKNDTKVNIKAEGVTVLFGSSIVVPIQTINQNQSLYAWYGNDKKYILAQADLDTLGNVVSFQFQAKEELPLGLENISKTVESSIQPNPAGEELHINFTSNYAEKGTLVVVDITGKIIINQSINIVKDANDVTVKTADLNNGIYFTRIVSEHINTTSKFVVRH